MVGDGVTLTSKKVSYWLPPVAITHLQRSAQNSHVTAAGGFLPTLPPSARGWLLMGSEG